MQASDAFWHLVNFCAAPLGLGGFSALIARLLWRGELRGKGVGVLSLWVRCGAAALIAQVAGLIVFERDGRMATYAAMVVASALALWWAGSRAKA